MPGNVSGLSRERFADGGGIPNSRLPVLIYSSALPPAEAGPEAMEALFEENLWPPQWRSSIFTYHHYHSTAHEVLGIARGSARVMFGGPTGREFEVSAGDVVVIPAGVGHRRLSSTPGFLVVGGYPPGQTWDLLTGAAGERPKADETIARVPMPTTDPVGGERGGVVEDWPQA